MQMRRLALSGLVTLGLVTIVLASGRVLSRLLPRPGDRGDADDAVLIIA